MYSSSEDHWLSQLNIDKVERVHAAAAEDGWIN